MSSDLVLSELRVFTRAEHDRIERILQLAEPMTLARYAAVMAGFDAFLRAWEPRVQAALPPRLQPWFRARRRGGFAAADIAWLHDVAGESAPAPDASAVDGLPLDSLPQVLGSVYVIEGSALGGRVIAPQLKARLDLAPGCGASYFHGFGSATGDLWRDFRVLASLEIGEAGGAVVQACRSARRTFELLIELFAPLAPPASADDAGEVVDVFGLPAVAALLASAGPGPGTGPDTGPDTVIDVLEAGEPHDTVIDVLDAGRPSASAP